MDKCITVSYGLVKGSAKKYPYYQPAMYTAHTTLSGKLVWKYDCHIGRARRSISLARKDAMEAAVREKCPFIEAVRQWKPVSVSSRK